MLPLIGKKPHQRILPGEQLVIKWRTHWANEWQVSLQTVAIVIGLYLFHRVIFGNLGGGAWVFDGILWFGSLAAIARLAWYYLNWWCTIVMITDKRFLRCDGVITGAVAMMPMSKVTDLSFKTPLLGGILGYGSVHIESAGQDQDLDKFRFVPHIDQVEEAVAKLQFGTGSEHGSPVKIRKLTRRERRSARRQPGTMDEVTKTWAMEDDGS
ncbi:MAG: PH domain-containing protein [Actinomycetota bacterium]|nr:PH domain-containing protein [Actinomycetota bacterium]